MYAQFYNMILVSVPLRGLYERKLDVARGGDCFSVMFQSPCGDYMSGNLLVVFTSTPVTLKFQSPCGDYMSGNIPSIHF